MASTTSSSTSSHISILPAEENDLPWMVQITTLSTEPDLLNHFLWSQDYNERIDKHTDSLMASLGKRFTAPTNPCYILKAVEQREMWDEREGGYMQEEILGWCLVRWEDGTWLDAPLPEGEDFRSVYGREVRAKWKAVMEGKGKHVVLGALYVKPARQRQGIGRKLIEFIDEKYELKKETVIVQTRAMSEGFYGRTGWVTVDKTDMDLGRWGGEGRGYGLHQSPQMIRWPEGEKAAAGG